MKTRDLPRAEQSLTPRYYSNLGIKSYDADNLYPQNVRTIVRNSKTGGGCLERLCTYMEGNGIASEALGSFVVNHRHETLNDLHALISADLATFNGFAIHVNYNVEGRIVELQHIPFENVRLTEPDEDGNIQQIALHPDWSEHETRGGRVIRVRRENIDYIQVFAPERAAIQMQEAGGPLYYGGQVLYYSAAGYLQYPLAPYDKILTDLSTDEGLSNLMLRNARMNFIPAGAWVHYKGQGRPGDEYNEQESEGYYSDELRELQGDKNAMKVMDFTIESKDDMPEFVKIQGENIDKEFTATATEVKDCIYSAFGQEGFLSLRNGKVGFSGTLVADVTTEYANQQKKAQAKLTQTYLQLFRLWGGEPLPDIPTAESLRVLPLTYTTGPNTQKTVEKQ